MNTYPIGSYTFFNDALNCPHKAYRRYVVRNLPRMEPTPELVWGRLAHETLENRLTKETPLLPELKNTEPLCAELAQLPRMRVEYRLAIDREGQSVSWDSNRAWFRGKADVAAWDGTKAWLLDWKTGKTREEPFELECQAVLLRASHPELNDFGGQYYWLKENKLGLYHTLEPDRTLERLRAQDTQLRKYNDAGFWPKVKNPLCGWCDVLDCEHNCSEQRK